MSFMGLVLMGLGAGMTLAPNTRADTIAGVLCLIMAFILIHSSGRKA
jgi:hypothetical protein